VNIMLELFLIIILFVGLFGMGVVVYRKIPLLRELPDSSGEIPQVSQVFQKVKERSNEEITKITGPGKINRDLYLQKILSKVRVLTLKTENKTALWLERLRRKKHNHGRNDYWQELKNAKNGKKPA